MSKIKVTSKCEIYDGMSITFKAPCDCTAVDGLNVYYHDRPYQFSFRDTHGNDLAGIRNLFTAGSYVKVVLDTASGFAYIQNADSNAYLEARLDSILTDETKTLYGLGKDAVPDDVLGWVGKHNLHWWARRAISSGWREIRNDVDGNLQSGTGQLVFNAANTTSNVITVTYADSIVIDQKTGTVTLGANQGTVDVSYDGYADAVVLKGKYIQNVKYDADTIFYVSETAGIFRQTVSSSSTTKYRVYCETGAAWEVTSVWWEARDTWQYLQSASRNAYPDSGDVDGWEYRYYGIPFKNAVTAPKVEVGTYVGTGGYKADNPTVLAIGENAKAVFIMGVSNGYSGHWINGGAYVQTETTSGNTSGNAFCNATYNDGVLSWYNTTNSTNQLNGPTMTYAYIVVSNG